MSDSQPTVGDVLDELFQAHGALTPEIVVEAAVPETSPLHSHFEWDNAKAGHSHRLTQAAGLIRMVYITRVNDGEEFRVRKFHCERDLGRATIGSYVPLEEVERDPILMENRLSAALRDFNAYKRRYGHLRGLRNLILANLPPDNEATVTG